MNVTSAPTAIARSGLMRGAARVGALTAAGAGGFAAAHAISDRGDYQHNRKWQMSATAAALGIGAGAALLGSRGGRIANSALAGAEPLASEIQIAALNAAQAPGVAASQRLDDAVFALSEHLESAQGTHRLGMSLVQAGAMVGVGGAAGIAVTSARLDPGILHVQADWNVKHETKSFGEQRADEARGILDAAGDVVGGVADKGGGLLDTLNPFN